MRVHVFAAVRILVLFIFMTQCMLLILQPNKTAHSEIEIKNTTSNDTEIDNINATEFNFEQFHDNSTIFSVENVTVLERDDLVVLQTAFYYKTSSLYNDSTMVMLINADNQLQKPESWTCRSQNLTETQVSSVEVYPTLTNGNLCRWTVFIARCPVVANPSFLSISINETSTEEIAIPFELPDRKPHGIVSCFPPMYFEERWQAIALTHELYAAWGVDLQVHYVHSTVGDMIKLLTPFVVKKLLEIRSLDITDFGPELNDKLGYIAYQSTEFRHQLMAIHDCYFRYRESAEFIMVNDPDDVFVPLKGKTLLDEFRYWKTKSPTASSFIYRRATTVALVPSSIENFNFSKFVKSITIKSRQPEIYKSVYDPKYTEVAWIHGADRNITPSYFVPFDKTLCMHIRYVKTIKERVYPLSSRISLDNFMQPNSTVINYANLPHDMQFPETHEYADAINRCYHHRNSTVPECITPTFCPIPARNVKCTIAVRSYGKECITHDRIQLCMYKPKSASAQFITKDDGCAVGNFTLSASMFDS